MKPIILFALCLCAAVASAADVKFSELPNASVFQTGDLLIFARPGDKNYNIEATTQLPSALGLGSAAFTSSGAYDAAGTAQTVANTTSNLLNGTINTSSNLVFGNALTQINTTSNLLQSQITSGGVTLTQLNATSNSVYGNAVTQINTTSNLLNGSINTSSNLVFGNAQTAINTSSNSVLGNAQTAINTTSNVLAGVTATKANAAVTITIAGSSTITSSTATAQPLSGNVSTVLSIADPLSLGQINAGIFWATNMVTSTNAAGGTLADFGKASWTTNMAGGFTFSGVANLTLGADNATIYHMYPAGSDRALGFPSSWHLATNLVSVVAASINHSDLLITCQPSFSTNVAKIDYP